MSEQLRLDFEGPFACAMGALRAKLRGVPAAQAGLSGVRWRNVCELLMAVYAHAGAEDGRYAQAPAERMAGTAELGRSALYVARRDAVALGLLVEESCYDRRTGARRPARLWVDTAKVDLLVSRARQSQARIGQARGGVPSAAAAGRPAEPTVGRPTDPQQAGVADLGGASRELSQNRALSPNPAKSGLIRPSPGKSGLIRAGAGGRAHIRAGAGAPACADPLNPRTLVPSYPTTAVPCAAQPAAAAEKRLFGLGLMPEQARQAVEALEAAGCPADGLLDAVDAVLAWWADRPGAWGLGAVLLRLRRWRPGQAPGEGWPPPAAEWVRAQELEQREQRKQREAERRALDAERREQERAALAAERGGGFSALAEYQIMQREATT